MTYLKKFKHDVFISYARVDDEEGDQWVSTFKEKFEKRLASRLGRRDAARVWMDHELAGNLDLESQIHETLASAATLLVVLSPGYMASPWCNLESNTFLKQRANEGAVFVAHRYRVDETIRDQLFPGLLGYTFWTYTGSRVHIPLDPARDAHKTLYDEEMYRLVYAVEARLREMKAQPAPPRPSPATTVYLAEVTDDIDHKRSEVRQHLDQLGIRVVPDTWYPRAVDDYRACVDADLTNAALFVQLLSEYRGKPLPGSNVSSAELQHARAKELGKLIMQWRNPELEMGSLQPLGTAGLSQDLIFGPTVQAVDLADFKRNVEAKLALLREEQRRAEKQERVKAEANLAQDYVTILVNRADSDSETALEICNHLKTIEGEGHVYAFESDDSLNRQERVEDLHSCDGMILVYGQVGRSWVKGQIREALKILSMRRNGFYPWAVYEGPPPGPKAEVRFHSPFSVMTISGQLDVDQVALRGFVDEIRKNKSITRQIAAPELVC